MKSSSSQKLTIAPHQVLSSFVEPAEFAYSLTGNTVSFHRKVPCGSFWRQPKTPAPRAIVGIVGEQVQFLTRVTNARTATDA
jgi:hypothetical protein